MTNDAVDVDALKTEILGRASAEQAANVQLGLDNCSTDPLTQNFDVSAIGHISNFTSTTCIPYVYHGMDAGLKLYLYSAKDLSRINDIIHLIS